MYDFTLAPSPRSSPRTCSGSGPCCTAATSPCGARPSTAIGGFDTRIEFHGEDTNLGRRLVPHGRVVIAPRCFVFTSARRFVAMGRGQVFRLYIRNFWSEIVHHRPADVAYRDVGR